MLLVMPVCSVDLALARELSGWIRDLGPERRHNALLMWSAEVPQEDRDYILENFRNTFGKVNQMQPYFPDYVQGWPDAPNLTFEFTVHYCCVEHPRYAEGRPWFFFEADQTPLRAGWLDALEEEYFRAGKSCLGVLEQSWMVRPGEPKVPAGKHLVGTAIYPGNFNMITGKYRGIRGMAFDVALQDEVVGGGHAAHTNLMLHCWLTENFRRDVSGDIVCDTREGRLVGQIGYSLNRTVREDAGHVLVHGCKDGSLLRLLREERQKANPVSKQPVVAEPALLDAMMKPHRRRMMQRKGKSLLPGVKITDPQEVIIHRSRKLTQATT